MYDFLQSFEISRAFLRAKKVGDKARSFKTFKILYVYIKD